MKEFVKSFYKFGRWVLAGIFMVTVLCGSFTTAYANDKAEAQSIIDKSKGVLTDLMGEDALIVAIMAFALPWLFGSYAHPTCSR